MATTTHTQRLYSAYLETRDELPGWGVLDIMHGLCLVARVDGNTVRVIRERKAPLLSVPVFPSPSAAWDYLSDERNRREWDDAH